MTAPAGAAVDDEPSGIVPSRDTLAHVRTLYERAHAREHGRGATIIEDWRLFADGVVGSYRTWRLGRDERDVTTLGPLVSAHGVVRGTHWEQDRNGVVFSTSDIRDLRDTIDERTLRDNSDERDVRLLGESPALGAYVVELNPPTGRHAWVYVDRRTGLVLRRERIERRRRTTVTYDDYRLVDGIEEPSRIHSVDSLGNEREQLLVSRSFDDTPDPHDVEMPANRKLVDFPDRVTTLPLPVRIVNGIAIVRVEVGHGIYDFALDSGAAGIVIDPSVVDQQGLERYGERVGATLGTFPESTTIVPQMSVGALHMHNVVARVVATPFHPDDRTRLAGLLGFDFFADLVLHIDTLHDTADASEPERFRAPADTNAVALDLAERTSVVHVHAGSATARVVLDTGANRTLFTGAYADRADFAPERVATQAHIRGIGGVAGVEATHVSQIELSGIPVRDTAVDVTSADLGSDDIDGIVGSDVLRAYDIWFDYHTNAVYVRRPPTPKTVRPALSHRR
jgi:hypothetical protein